MLGTWSPSRFCLCLALQPYLSSFPVSDLLVGITAFFIFMHLYDAISDLGSLCMDYPISPSKHREQVCEEF